MPQNFIECDREQELLLPPNMRDWLPEDHLAWFVLDAVEEMDLQAFYGAYRQDGWGRAAFEPKVMVALLLYAYAVGERSSRSIERRCREDVAFRVLAANQIPDHATIARFRARHEQALADTFEQVLALCARAGLVSVGLVALDGSLIAANASQGATRSYPQIRAEVERMLEEAAEVAGDEHVYLDEESLSKYGRDETENLHFLPEIVIKPRTALEISGIMKICNREKIPVTPRGAGTGLSGGALPHLGGVLLSTERMNTILEIDERNLQVTTEPGVITEVLQNAVKEKGLFYPPDPASRGSCFIGGNIAENSGGPKAVKYGVVKDYVLNLEIVLPSGEVMWTGSNVLKNSTGYNLTQLVVGSEGTLGIVTKIVLRLIPLPKYDLLMLVPFKSWKKLAKQ